MYSDSSLADQRESSATSVPPPTVQPPWVLELRSPVTTPTGAKPSEKFTHAPPAVKYSRAGPVVVPTRPRAVAYQLVFSVNWDAVSNQSFIEARMRRAPMSPSTPTNHFGPK